MLLVTNDPPQSPLKKGEEDNFNSPPFTRAGLFQERVSNQEK